MVSAIVVRPPQPTRAAPPATGTPATVAPSLPRRIVAMLVRVVPPPLLRAWRSSNVYSSADLTDEWFLEQFSELARRVVDSLPLGASVTSVTFTVSSGSGRTDNVGSCSSEPFQLVRLEWYRLVLNELRRDAGT